MRGPAKVFKECRLHASIHLVTITILRVLNTTLHSTQNDFQLDATPETELYTADVFVYHSKRSHCNFR